MNKKSIKKSENKICFQDERNDTILIWKGYRHEKENNSNIHPQVCYFVSLQSEENKSR